MTKAAAKKTTTAQITDLYDAEAKNRLEFKFPSGGSEYDVAFIFLPVSDDRYLTWLRDFKLQGDGERMDEETMASTCTLFDDICESMENVEFDGDDWKALVPIRQKIDATNNLLAVAAFDPESKGDGPLKLTAQTTRVVLTEAYFNGSIVQQKHILKEETIEWKKKYSRVQAKRFRREITRGLSRQAKVEYVPQHTKLAELYDEMLVSNEGFAGNVVPLRFKTNVIEHIFESEYEPAAKK